MPIVDTDIKYSASHLSITTVVESSEYDVYLLKLQHFYNTKILQNHTNVTVVFWQNSIQCYKNVA